jgi:small subunit ribosomal protein S4e
LGRKEGSTGLKREPAPRFWPIHRKKHLWVVKPSAGPHSLGNCLSLAIILRDVLGFAKTRKEAKTIVLQGKVRVDGRVRREDDFPVGLMDVISISDIDKCFRIVPSSRGLTLHSISKEESDFKLCRIEDKKVVKNGHIQLKLHDGSNILVKVSEPKNSQTRTYKTLDTLKISLPERQILEHIKMKEKDFAIMTSGKNIGKHGKIIEIKETKGKKRRNVLVTIEDEKGNRYKTILSFVFAIGEEKPLISIPETEQIVRR